MKLKGPVRKVPPIAETRKKLSSQALQNVQKELDQLLEEFSDLFSEQFLKGRPPKQQVKLEIKVEGRGHSAEQATLSPQSKGAR